MTEDHRRHLTTSARYIAQLLGEANRYAQDMRTRDALHAVGDELRVFAEHFRLDLREREVDALHAIRVQLSVVSISVAEMRSRALRGYGPLAESEARELDTSCDLLESAIDRAQNTLDAL